MTPTTEQIKHCGELKQSEGETIKFDLRLYKEKWYVDIRLWFMGRYEKTLMPTRKGFSFPVELLPQFKKIVAEMTV